MSEPGPALASGTGATIRLRDGVRDAVFVFLAVRLGLFVISLIAGAGLLAVPFGQPATDSGFPPPSLEPGWHLLFTATLRQDGLWFLRLATEGWAPGDPSAAFFPLYPVVVRFVTWIPGVGPLAAALIVSNLAFLGSLIVFHGLTRLELGEGPIARRAVTFLAVFPTAFFFLAPYSESLFLLLALLTFWCARRDRWGWAMAAGAAAAATRSIGVLLLVALAVEALRQWRTLGRPLWPRLLAAAGVAIGPATYLAWWHLAHADLWAPLDAQRRWGRETAWPPWTLWQAAVYAWRYLSYWMLDLVVVVAAIVGIAAVWRRHLAPYLAYAVVGLALPLMAPSADRPLLSMPRFVIVSFPLAWGYALLVERLRLPDGLVTGVFAAGYGLMACLFVAWQYVF